MNNIKIITISVIAILIISAGTAIYNIYFQYRLKQKHLEKAFNKNILKSAGFTSVGKRLFDFVFDLVFFWLIFYYEDGFFYSMISDFIDGIIIKPVFFLMPISRVSFKKISFFLYSPTAVFLISLLASILLTMAFLDEHPFSKHSILTCFLFVISIVLFWYINLGICYLFFRYLKVGLNSSIRSVVLAILCYILILIADYGSGAFLYLIVDEELT